MRGPKNSHSYKRVDRSSIIFLASVLLEQLFTEATDLIILYLHSYGLSRLLSASHLDPTPETHLYTCTCHSKVPEAPTLLISVLVSGSTKYTCGSEKKVVMRGVGIFLVLFLMLSTLVFFSVTCSTFPDLSTVQTVERETPVASVFTVLF